MKIILHKISQESLQHCTGNRKVIFYGDFNVINHLYENNIILDRDIIVYPDSTAVYLALISRSVGLKKNVSTDLQDDLLINAIKNGKVVFFFGDSEEVLTLVNRVLSEKYNYNCNAFPGYNFQHKDVIKTINSVKPDILFVGLGAGRQEKWVLENYSYLNVPLIITVGGWFRYLSGIKKRAPLWIRKIHFEWLHKLITEYNRVWKRYFYGAPLFYYRILTRKIRLELRDEAAII